MEIAGKILDFLDDPEASLVKQAVAGGVTIPAFVLGAEPPQNVGQLDDQFFGLVTKVASRTYRKYACHTPASTWLSGLYFLKQGHVLPKETQTKVAGEIVRFFTLHGLQRPSYLEKVANGEASIPEPDAVSAYGTVTEDMFAITSGDRPRFPIPTLNEVKIAELYFKDRWAVLQPSERREFCVKLANRVRAMSNAAYDETFNYKGIPDPYIEKVATAVFTRKDPASVLDPLIRKYASQTPDDQMMKVAFFERMKIAKAQDNEGVFETYKALFENRGSYTIDKFAEALERIDRAANYQVHWNRRFPDPYLSTVKIAADPDEEVVYDTGAVRVTAGEIKKLARNQDVVAKQYEKGFAQEFAQEPVAVFESLPDPDKQALAGLAKTL